MSAGQFKAYAPTGETAQEGGRHGTRACVHVRLHVCVCVHVGAVLVHNFTAAFSRSNRRRPPLLSSALLP